ncbi:MAG TPA: S41 family peptidase [Treponemataceae bacterium]|nr:S41 family peptidase [Treponemataceae bacterium]
MKLKQNKIITTIFACVFAIVALFMPAGFAETPTVSDQINEADVRQYMELMNSIYGFVIQNYVDVVDPGVLYEGALKGMLEAFDDPHTAYLDKNYMRNLNDTTHGEFGGVGLSIVKPVESTVEKPAYVEVKSPIEDTPGWKAGIQAGDFITEIDGTATPEITMEKVLDLLRGRPGTKVTIRIKRGKNMDFPVTLTRAMIETPTVKYAMLQESKHKTAYLRIIEFSTKTDERVEEAFDYFATQGYDSLLIDLRNNPGGLITSVATVADKFIDSGIIVSTKSRLAFENMVFEAEKKKTIVPADIPIVVLINGGSASAAEIFSGCLKDNKRAFLAGEKSFGKGSVQQVVDLPNKDGLKLTIARYYTPSDAFIDKRGIIPDFEIKFPELDEDEEKAYVKLIEDDIIEQYVQDHANMTEDDIEDYASKLKRTYNLEARLLRRIIRLEVGRTRGSMIYDYDFDIQIQKALEIFEKPDFATQLKDVKTVYVMQKELLAQDSDNVVGKMVKSENQE